MGVGEIEREEGTPELRAAATRSNLKREMMMMKKKFFFFLKIAENKVTCTSFPAFIKEWRSGLPGFKARKLLL